VGLEQILFDSAQRPRQTLIRVPVVMGGIVIVVWQVDGILENYSLGAGKSPYWSFRWTVSKKLNEANLSRTVLDEQPMVGCPDIFISIWVERGY
jgi:hypothetical protein